MPFRSFAALGALATLAMGLALTAALDATSFHVFSGELDSAERWTAGAMAVGLGSVAVATLLLAACAVVRHGRHEWHVQRRLARLPAREIDGTAVLVLPDARLLAFCTGALRPRVCVSRGVVDALDPAELAAVVAHERHHADRRDPLRLVAVDVAARALFFVPGLKELGARCRDAADLAADAAAERRSGPRPLAGAMLRFADAPAGGVAAMRVDRLLGDEVSFRVRAGQVLPGIVATSVLLGLVALLTSATGCDHLEVWGAGDWGQVLTGGLLPLGAGALALLVCTQRRRVRLLK